MTNHSLNHQLLVHSITNYSFNQWPIIHSITNHAEDQTIQRGDVPLPDEVADGIDVPVHQGIHAGHRYLHDHVVHEVSQLNAQGPRTQVVEHPEVRSRKSGEVNES